MNVIFVNEGKAIALAALTGQVDFAGTMFIGLMRSPLTPSDLHIYADVLAADYTGYNPQAIAWSSVEFDINGNAFLPADTVLWRWGPLLSGSGPIVVNLIWGYYLFSTLGPTLILFESFSPAPQPMYNVDDFVSVSPTLSLGNCCFGSGSGSGGSGSSGSAPFGQCCTDAPAPDCFLLTVSGFVATDTCPVVSLLNGNFTLMAVGWDEFGAPNEWQDSVPLDTTACGGALNAYTWLLQCIDGSFFCGPSFGFCEGNIPAPFAALCAATTDFTAEQCTFDFGGVTPPQSGNFVLSQCPSMMMMEARTRDTAIATERARVAALSHRPAPPPTLAATVATLQRPEGLPQAAPECRHRGAETGELAKCAPCGPRVSLKLMACAVHGDCTPTRPVAGHQCCLDCPERNIALDGPAEYWPACADPIPTRVLTPHPKGWGKNASLRKRHVDALFEVMGRKHQAPACKGEGIVWIGGGKYWPMIATGIRLLREVGCRLPVEVWYRGRAEPCWLEDVEDCAPIRLVDATKHPSARYARTLTSWPMKTFAVANCPYERVLYLDADAYAVANPAPLFELLNNHPFVYWEDIESMEAHTKWESTGVRNDGKVAPIQGGHWLVNKSTWWHELMCWMWYEQHSDYWHKTSWSDQEGLRQILTHLKSYGFRLDRVKLLPVGFDCQWNGASYVVHRVQGKKWAPWDRPVGYQDMQNPHLPLEQRYLSILEDVLSAYRG